MFLNPNQLQLDRTNHGAGTMAAAEGLANEFKGAFDREAIDKGIRQISDRMFDNKPMSQQEMSDAILALPSHLRSDIIDGFQRLQGVTTQQREMALGQANIILDGIGSSATAMGDMPEEERAAFFKTFIRDFATQHGAKAAEQISRAYGGKFDEKTLFNNELRAGTLRHTTGIVQQQTQARQRVRDTQILRAAGQTTSKIQEYESNLSRLIDAGYPRNVAIEMALRLSGISVSEALTESLGGANLDAITTATKTAPEGSQGAGILAGETTPTGTATITATGTTTETTTGTTWRLTREQLAERERVKEKQREGEDALYPENTDHGGTTAKGKTAEQTISEQFGKGKKALDAAGKAVASAFKERTDNETKDSLLRPRTTAAQEMNDAQNFMNYMGVPKEAQKAELKRIAVENRDRLSEEGKGSIEGAASKSVENLSAGAEMALRVLKEAGSAAHEAAPPQVQKAMDKVAQKAGGLGAAAFGKLIEAGKRLGLDKSQIISELKRIAEAMAKGASPERMAAEGRK